MTRRRRRWEKDQEKLDRDRKAGKIRPVLMGGLPESRKDKAEREAYEASLIEIPETAARNEAMWAAMFPPGAPSDPEPDP